MMNIAPPDSDPLNIFFLGGGMRVSNSNYASRGKTSRFTIRDPTKSNKSNLKVGYTNDFADVFGMTVTDVESDTDAKNATIEFTVNSLDHLGSADPQILAYSVNLPQVGDDIIISVQRPPLNIPQDEIFNRDDPDPLHIQTLISLASVAIVNDFNRGGGDDFASYGVMGESYSRDTHFEETDARFITNTKHGGEHKSGIDANIDDRFSRSDVLSISASNRVTNTATGKSQKLYGPQKYVTILFIDDQNNTESDKSKSLITIINEVVMEGVELTNVRKTSTEGPPNLINHQSVLEYYVEFSNENKVNVTDVSELALLTSSEQDSDGNFTIDSTTKLIHFDSSLIEQTGIKDSSSDRIVHIADNLQLVNITSDYQGPVYGYVQFQQITWNPKSIYDTGLIFDTTNEGEYKLEYIDRTEFSLRMKVVTFGHATDVSHQVTLNAKSQGNPDVIFVFPNSLSRNEFRYEADIQGLVPNTMYEIVMTVDDGLNTPYIESMLNLMTANDDDEGPDIQLLHVVGHSDSIAIHARVVDAKSPLNTPVFYAAFTANGYDYFQLLTAEAKETFMKNENVSNVNFTEGPTIKDQTMRINLMNAFTNDQHSTEAIRVDTTYYVVVFAEDETAVSNNPTIVVQDVTTYAPIQIDSELVIVDGAGTIEVKTKFEFAKPDTMKVWCAIFEDPQTPSEITALTMMQAPHSDTKNDVNSGETVEFETFIKTVSENSFRAHTDYFIVIYATSTLNTGITMDQSYDLYDSVLIYPYTKQDLSGPVIRDATVNFDQPA